MLMKKKLLALTIAIFILSACAPATSEPVPINKTSTPQVLNIETIPAASSTKSKFTRGSVYLDSTELLIKESDPLQFTLALTGNLPTPCDQLRVEADAPDVENKIMVNVYSVTPPKTICTQVLQPFEENFPLGNFPAGHYTLWVNGQLIAEFDA
jgi:hypothetical protein